MSAEANKAIVRRFIDEAWNKKNPDIAEELCARSYVYHGSDHEPGPQIARDLILMFAEAFPDAAATIDTDSCRGRSGRHPLDDHGHARGRLRRAAGHRRARGHDRHGDLPHRGRPDRGALEQQRHARAAAATGRRYAGLSHGARRARRHPAPGSGPARPRPRGRHHRAGGRRGAGARTLLLHIAVVAEEGLRTGLPCPPDLVARLRSRRRVSAPLQPGAELPGRAPAQRRPKCASGCAQRPSRPSRSTRHGPLAPRRATWTTRSSPATGSASAPAAARAARACCAASCARKA